MRAPRLSARSPLGRRPELRAELLEVDVEVGHRRLVLAGADERDLIDEQIEYYRQQPSLNIDTRQRKLFFREAETALAKLKQQEK